MKNDDKTRNAQPVVTPGPDRSHYECRKFSFLSVRKTVIQLLNQRQGGLLLITSLLHYSITPTRYT